MKKNSTESAAIYQIKRSLSRRHICVIANRVRAGSHQQDSGRREEKARAREKSETLSENLKR